MFAALRNQQNASASQQSSEWQWPSSSPPNAQQPPERLTSSQLENLFNGTIGNPASRTPSRIPETPIRSQTPDRSRSPPPEDAVHPETADDAVEGAGLRFNCRYFFLTFPRCNLDPTRFALKFKSLGVDDYHLVQEKHSDDETHYHAIVAFAKQKNVRNPRFFDIDGHHPNIQKVKSLIKAVRYLEKEKHGSVGKCVGGTLGQKIKDGKVGVLDTQAKLQQWKEATEQADTAQSFLSAVDNFDPITLAKSFSNIQAYSNWKYKKQSTTEYTRPNLGEGTWILPQPIADWVMTYITSPFEGTYFRTLRSVSPRTPPPFAPLRGSLTFASLR